MFEMKPHLLLGTAYNSQGQMVIVMALDQVPSFAVWDQAGQLFIYDGEQGDVIEPMHADTVWEAIGLFKSWYSCEVVLQ